MEQLGKIAILLGIALLVTGAAVVVLAKLGLLPGRLPGDIHIEGKGTSFHFPVVTCLVASVVLTAILNLILRWWR